MSASRWRQPPPEGRNRRPAILRAWQDVCFSSETTSSGGEKQTFCYPEGVAGWEKQTFCYPEGVAGCLLLVGVNLLRRGDAAIPPRPQDSRTFKDVAWDNSVSGL
ncbi:hypothetical protein AVEN_240760-1 [Araneus ventricosus]|uniref:Uncharacterized protein n=1 Tax=Araneus ventricosus TaxID=182803 RepID=A0A4Y2BZA9_ARAVE|nr:hypothetical protein AVEN_240760-1 [Araneus ventricosus]